jgi:hypothetical protein
MGIAGMDDKSATSQKQIFAGMGVKSPIPQ